MTVGSRSLGRAHLIASLVIAAGSGTALAAPSASELMQQGLEAFKVGHYEEAISAIQHAYDLEPKPDTLFALAQAERLGGHCDNAIPHYKKVLEQLADLDKAKLVQSNLSLCEKTLKIEPSDKAPPPGGEPAVTKAMVRVEGTSDRLATAAFAFGALGIGAGAGLLIAANSSEDDANHARTLADNHRLNDRSDLQRGLAVGAFGLGGVLIGVAIVRWVRGGDASEQPTVTLAPGPSSATVSVFARW